MEDFQGSRQLHFCKYEYGVADSPREAITLIFWQLTEWRDQTASLEVKYVAMSTVDVWGEKRTASWQIMTAAARTGQRNSVLFWQIVFHTSVHLVAMCAD